MTTETGSPKNEKFAVPHFDELTADQRRLLPAPAQVCLILTPETSEEEEISHEPVAAISKKIMDLTDMDHKEMGTAIHETIAEGNYHPPYLIREFDTTKPQFVRTIAGEHYVKQEVELVLNNIKGAEPEK